MRASLSRRPWHIACPSDGQRDRDDRGSQTTLRVADARRTNMNWMTSVRRFVKDDSGQDLLEYALLVGLIALVAVLAVTSTGTSVNKIFNTISQSLANVA